MAGDILYENEKVKNDFQYMYAASNYRRLKKALAGYAEDKAEAIEEIGRILMAHGAPENYYIKYNEISEIINADPENAPEDLVAERANLQALMEDVMVQMIRVRKEDIEKRDSQICTRDYLTTLERKSTATSFPAVFSGTFSPVYSAMASKNHLLFSIKSSLDRLSISGKTSDSAFTSASSRVVK